MPFASVEATARQFARVRAACEAQAATPPDPRDLREHAVPGTPGEVVARLRAFADDGASPAFL